jgi:hypothetical protein
MLKISFRVILKNLMPETLSYLMYINSFEDSVSKRDLTYMKKLSRPECIHYAQEKGVNKLDTYFAL